MKRKMMGRKEEVEVIMPVLTSASQNGWICEESSRHVPTSAFWKALDGRIIHDITNAADMAHTGGSDSSPSWILSCPYSVRLYKVLWYNRDINSQYLTNSIYIDGFNGNDWEQLGHHQVNKSVLSFSVEINNKKEFLKYRIRGSSAYLICTELKLYMKRYLKS